MAPDDRRPAEESGRDPEGSPLGPQASVEEAAAMAAPVAQGSGAEEAFGRAARNTAARALGEALGKVASLVFFAALARQLGATGVGVFVFALAWAEISMMLASLGLDRALIRWIARDRTQFADLFVNGLGIKLALAIPIAIVSFVAINVLTYGSTTRVVVYVLTLGALLDALTRVAVSVFTAFERGELTGICLVAQRIAGAALGIGALALGFHVVAVAITYTVASALTLLLAVVLLRRRLKLGAAPVDTARWRSLAARSVPFAVQDVFTVLLFRIDAVILSLMATTAAVGRYGSAYRLFESTFFLTYALAGAFAPMYTYLERDSDPPIQSVFERSMKLALVLLVPCAAVFGVLAPFVSRAFFGSGLENASGALRILAPVVVLIGLVLLSTSLIVSRRSPRVMVWLSAGMTLFNIVLNVALIPALHERGSALAMLITEAVFLVLAFRMAVRTIGGGVRWLPMTGAPLLAGLAMAACMFAFRAHPGVALGSGVVVYSVGFLALERLISPSDLGFVLGFLRRRLALRNAA